MSAMAADAPHVALHGGTFRVEEIKRQPGVIAQAQRETDGGNRTRRVLTRFGGKVEHRREIQERAGAIQSFLNRLDDRSLVAGRTRDGHPADGAIRLHAGKAVETADDFDGDRLDKALLSPSVADPFGWLNLSRRGGFWRWLHARAAAEEQCLLRDDVDVHLVRTQRDERDRLLVLDEMEGIEAAGIRVRKQTQRRELEAGGGGGLLVGLDEVALHGGDEHLELRRKRGRLQRGGVGFGVRFETRRRKELAPDLEVDHRFVHAERQILADLEVNHRRELADVIQHGKRQRAQDHLRARHAHHDRAGLVLKLGQRARDRGTEDVGVAEICVRGNLQHRSSDTGDVGASARVRRLNHAQRLAFDHESRGLTCRPGTTTTPERRELEHLSQRLLIHGEPPLAWMPALPGQLPAR